MELYSEYLETDITAFKIALPNTVAPFSDIFEFLINLRNVPYIWDLFHLTNHSLC